MAWYIKLARSLMRLACHGSSLWWTGDRSIGRRGLLAAATRWSPKCRWCNRCPGIPGYHWKGVGRRGSAGKAGGSARPASKTAGWWSRWSACWRRKSRWKSTELQEFSKIKETLYRRTAKNCWPEVLSSWPYWALKSVKRLVSLLYVRSLFRAFNGRFGTSRSVCESQ